MPEITEKEKEKARKSTEEYQRTVDVQVDTVSAESAGRTGAYFQSGKRSITVNHIKGNTKWNEWSESDNVLAHEQKHRDDYLRGIFAYPVSAELEYKRRMHAEIAANIASLVELRQKYIETGDISVFDAEQKRFSFYKEAIEKVEIDPNSPYIEDFDKEMSLIVNGTQKVWEEKFAARYSKAHLSKAMFNGDDGKYAAYWNENYKNSLEIAYNIGGVDFTKYMKKDVEIPKDILPILENLGDSSDNNRWDTDKVKNEPTDPVNTQAPEYREWKNEDGSRVSPVQHRKILDMTKPIIKQPTRSRAKEQSNNTATKMKSDAANSKMSTQNKTKPSLDKTGVKNAMIKDAANARKVAAQRKNIGRVAHTPLRKQIEAPSQMQLFKKLRHKVFE